MNFAEGDVQNANLRKVHVEVAGATLAEQLRLNCHAWLTIQKLKEFIRDKTGIIEDDQYIYSSNGLLDDQVFLNELVSKNRDAKSASEAPALHLTLATIHESERIRKLTFDSSQQIDSLIKSISKALDKNILPVKKSIGVSGLYQVKNACRSVIALFKPIDEEPVSELEADVNSEFKQNAQNVPESDSHRSHAMKVTNFQWGRIRKGGKNFAPNLGRPTVRKGLYSGELAEREVAAFMLDSKGIHGVPPTCMVEIDGSCFPSTNSESKPMTKRGSCQKFMANNGVVSNISFNKFSTREVQKIAILDLRILNCDRNEGNILFRRNPENDQIELIPIDHGLSLPDTLELYDSDLIWITWPQAFFPIEPELLDYIKTLDPKSNFYELKNNLNMRSRCLRNFRIAETFLKKCAEAGLTLGRIAKLMYRSNENARSDLEKFVEQTEFIYKNICGTIGKDFYIGGDVNINSNRLLPKLWKIDINRSRLSSYGSPLELSPAISEDINSQIKEHSKFTVAMRLNKANFSEPFLKEISASVRSHHKKFTLENDDTIIASPDNKKFIVPFNKNLSGSSPADDKPNCPIKKTSSDSKDDFSKDSTNSNCEDVFAFNLIKPIEICHKTISESKPLDVRHLEASKSRPEDLTKPIKTSSTYTQNSPSYFSNKKDSLTSKKSCEENLSSPPNEPMAMSSKKSRTPKNIDELVFDRGNDFIEGSNASECHRQLALQRSLSIQKQFRDHSLPRKGYNEEGGVPQSTFDSNSDELFFYFFESYVDQFLMRLKSKKQRRYTQDSHELII
jgi:hypothetical protein